jgi:hypothetical protein
LRTEFKKRQMSSVNNDGGFQESEWSERLDTAYSSNPSANLDVLEGDGNGRSPLSSFKSPMSLDGANQRGKNCFICNKPGHFASSCQEKSRIKCFNCGQPGHFSKEW